MVMILISWCGCSKRNCEYALVLEELIKPGVVLSCARDSVGRLH